MIPNINYHGVLLGILAFLIIGISHPVVAKAEYNFGKKIWWVFLTIGLICSISSLFFESVITSIILGTIGFSSFWSTHEIFKQHKRVVLGRAKRNPKRVYCYGGIFIFHSLNLSGVTVGAATFAIIAISRYLCIKAEYYFTKKFWIGFLLIGIASVAGSFFVTNLIVSVILGINGFTFLWGIGEIIEQEERVNKGWFPRNPKRG